MKSHAQSWHLNEETDSLQYLWETNCAIYATALAWKTYTDDNRKQQKHVTTTDPRPIWQRIIYNKITQLRRETSQITEEFRRLATNGKRTPIGN